MENSINAARDWPRILLFGVGDTITEKLVEQRYKQLAKTYHPDAGGSNEAMTELNLAKQLALKWIEGEQKRIAQLQRVAEEQRQILNQAQQMNNAMAQQMYAMHQSWANQSGMLGGWGSIAGSYSPSSIATENVADPHESRFRRFIKSLGGKHTDGR